MAEPRPLPDWRSERSAYAPFASIELIAMDLDGSLVADHAASVLDQIQTVQHGLRQRRSGHPAVKLTYATGRSLTWVASLLASLRLRLPSGTPLVLYNGSVVIEAHTGVILARSVIRAVAFSEIMLLRAELGSTLYAYNGPDERPTSLESGDEVCDWSDQSVSPSHDINGARVHWNPELIEGSFLPVAVLMDLPYAPNVRAEALAHLRRIAGLSLTTSAGPFVEIRPEGSNKAMGLQVAVDHLSVRQEHVLALGDSDNDAEMLRWAGIAVSVRGASSAALAQSDYVTRKGAAQGALEVLHAVKHARRWFPLVQEAS